MTTSSFPTMGEAGTQPEVTLKALIQFQIGMVVARTVFLKLHELKGHFE